MNLDEPGIPAEMPQRLVLASLSLVNFEPLVLLQSEPRHRRSTSLLEGGTALLHGNDLKCLESSSHMTDLGRRDCRWLTPGSKCSDDTVGISAGPAKAWRLRRCGQMPVQRKRGNRRPSLSPHRSTPQALGTPLGPARKERELF